MEALETAINALIKVHFDLGMVPYGDGWDAVAEQDLLQGASLLQAARHALERAQLLQLRARK